jgi:putative serine protease PepD
MLVRKPARIFRRKPNQLVFLEDLEEIAGKKRSLPTASLIVLALVAGLLGGVLGGDATKGLISSGVNLVSSTSTIERSPDSVAGLAARVLPSVVSIETTSADGGATGSGFVIDANGYLLTNNHVVAGSLTIKVLLNDGREFAARILGRDESYDLAVLKIEASGLMALQFGDSDKVQVGDPVIAIGSPLGLSGTVTQGIISAKNRPVTAGDSESDSATSFISALQTDAAINPGNSGGPLVDATGAVIGVNSAIASLGSSLGSQSGSIGLGFAIPINQARKTADQLIKNGKATYPVIGVAVDMNYNGVGALIAKSASAIMAGGPAAKAGLRAGDLITEIDGKKINAPEELIVEIRTHSVGDEVTITYIRGTKTNTAKLVLIAGK